MSWTSLPPQRACVETCRRRSIPQGANSLIPSRRKANCGQYQLDRQQLTASTRRGLRLALAGRRCIQISHQLV